jgi:hypothetical protein
MTLETVTSLVHRHHVGIRIHSYMAGNGTQSTPEMTFVIGHAGIAFTQTGRFRVLRPLGLSRSSIFSGDRRIWR